MRVAATLPALLCACGRLGFDAPADAPVDDGQGTVDGASVDAFIRPTAPPPGLNLVLDGSSYVTIDTVCAALVGGFTVSVWIRPTPGQGGRPYTEIVAFNSSGGGSNLALMQWITGTMRANYYDDAFTNGDYYDLPAPGSQWSYITLSVDAGGAGRLYVNGDLTQTFTTASTISGTSWFSLGQEWDSTTPGEFFIGDLDEVAIWRGARIPSELLGDMVRPPLQHPDLVAFFDFAAGAVTDLTGHGHVGTPVGSVAFSTH